MLSLRNAAVLLLLGALGCAAPAAQEPQRNRPPRIMLETVSPAIDVQYKPGCPLPFSAVVQDLDQDLIRSRWFVYAPKTAPTTYVDGTLAPTAAPGRLTTISAPSQLMTGDLIVPGQHHLHLVVADGEFDGSFMSALSRTLPMPDGGTETDPSYTDAWVWLVETNGLLANCQ